jgi:hypothetical protein
MATGASTVDIISSKKYLHNAHERVVVGRVHIQIFRGALSSAMRSLLFLT